MSDTGIRPAELIRQEITDLAEYLEGLPEALRASGAMQAYEARLAMLEQELVFAGLGEALPPRTPDHASWLVHPSMGSPVEQMIGAAQFQLENRLQAQAKLRAWLSVAGILGSGAAGLLTYVRVHSDVPLAAVVASAAVAFASMLANVFYTPVGAALEYQRKIDHLQSLRRYLSVSADAEPDAVVRARYVDSILVEIGGDAVNASRSRTSGGLQREHVP